MGRRLLTSERVHRSLAVLGAIVRGRAGRRNASSHVLAQKIALYRSIETAFQPFFAKLDCA